MQMMSQGLRLRMSIDGANDAMGASGGDAMQFSHGGSSGSPPAPGGGSAQQTAMTPTPTGGGHVFFQPSSVHPSWPPLGASPPGGGGTAGVVGGAGGAGMAGDGRVPDSPMGGISRGGMAGSAGGAGAAGSCATVGAGSPTDARFSLNLRKTALLRSLLLRTEDAAASASAAAAAEGMDPLGVVGVAFMPPTVPSSDPGVSPRPDSPPVPLFERVSSSDGEMSDGGGSGGSGSGGLGGSGGRGGAGALSAHLALHHRQMSGGSAGGDLYGSGGGGRGGMNRGPSSMSSLGGNSSTMDTTDDSDEDEQVGLILS